MYPPGSDDHADDILETWLQALDSGASPESTGQAAPDTTTPDLPSMLRVAQRLRALELPTMEPSAQHRIEMQLRFRTRELRTRQPAPVLRFPSAAAGRLAALAAVFLLVLSIGLGSAMAASAQSLPGSPLYPVKRAGESLQLTFSFDPGRRAELHSAFALRRLDEAIQISQRHHTWDTTVIAEMERELTEATENAQTASGERSLAAWEYIAEAGENGAAALSAAAADPVSAGPALQALSRARSKALLRLNKQAGKAEGAVTAGASPSPTSEATVVPTASESPTNNAKKSTVNTAEPPSNHKATASPTKAAKAKATKTNGQGHANGQPASDETEEPARDDPTATPFQEKTPSAGRGSDGSPDDRGQPAGGSNSGSHEKPDGGGSGGDNSSEGGSQSGSNSGGSGSGNSDSNSGGQGRGKNHD